MSGKKTVSDVAVRHGGAGERQRDRPLKLGGRTSNTKRLIIVFYSFQAPPDRSVLWAETNPVHGTKDDSCSIHTKRRYTKKHRR